MLHYVHQLVANFVCLSFGAGQVVYSVFFFYSLLAENSCLLWLETDENNETQRALKPKQ